MNCECCCSVQSKHDTYKTDVPSMATTSKCRAGSAMTAAALAASPRPPLQEPTKTKHIASMKAEAEVEAMAWRRYRRRTYIPPKAKPTRVGHSGKHASARAGLTVNRGQGLHSALPARLNVPSLHVTGADPGAPLHECPAGHMQLTGEVLPIMENGRAAGQWVQPADPATLA